MREYSSKEMKLLRENPYTYKVTKHHLFFTVEFKEAFWRGYQSGTTPRKLLIDLGYDLSLFKQKQIDSIVQRIKKEAESGQGFSEGINNLNRKRLAVKNLPVSNELLWNEVKYLRQEVEFIKKILKRGK